MNIEELKEILLKSNFEEFENALNGYEINQQDKYGNNILHYFIKEYKNLNLDYIKVIDLLISKGININERQLKGRFNRTPLHLAIFYRLKGITEYLVNSKVDVNVQDGNGNTPLSDAVYEYTGDDFFIQLLLNNGANPDLENEYNISARKLSKTIADTDVAKFFG